MELLTTNDFRIFHNGFQTNSKTIQLPYSENLKEITFPLNSYICLYAHIKNVILPRSVNTCLNLSEAIVKIYDFTTTST